jgi:LmbE family N-acetylglucosaminyl deacetylase
MPSVEPGPGSILGIWAHPDDEAYLTAGLMAAAARRGERVACVTATRGEEGSWDEDRWPSEHMGEVREEELERSLEILGVKEHHWLECVDGTLAGVEPDVALAKLVPVVRDVAPASVLTFGPDGMTGHPDHRSISAWATEAFRRAAPAGARLYHATYPPDWVEEFKPRFDRFNVFMEEGTPPVTPREQLDIAYRLPGDILDLKLRAIRAHVSQVEYMLEAFGADFFRRGAAEEFFVLAEER